MQIHLIRKDGIVLNIEDERRNSDGEIIIRRIFMTWDDVARLGVERARFLDTLAKNRKQSQR